MLKAVLKIIGFSFTLILVLNLCCNVLWAKDHNQFRSSLLYEQPTDSIDVLFVGTSHVHYSIDTGCLWDNYGMASYLISGNCQPIWCSYYSIEEALKNQSPKAIVLDVYRVNFDEEYLPKVYIANNTFGMRFGLTKLKAIEASASPEELADYLLEYPVYHGRYSDLKKEDFENPKAAEGYATSKGFYFETTTSDVNTHGICKSSDNKVSLSAKNEEYLYKIINLAKESGIPLMFVNSPWITGEKDRGYMNTIADIAKEENIPFLDASLLIDEIGLIACGENSDYYNSDHLNYRGALKYSEYLGNWLTSILDLPDRRSDSSYESWQADADNIRKQRDEQNSQIE